MYGYPSNYRSGSKYGYPQGGGPAPFLPSDVAGLINWAQFETGLFQDSAKTTPATGTDPVGAWEDSSGSGNDLLQATAGFRPALSSGAVDFDGTDDELLTAAAFTLKPTTLFILVNFNALSGNRRIWGANNADGLGLDHNGTDLRLLKANVALIGASTTALSTGSWFRIIVTYSGTGVYAFYVNGVLAGTGTNDQAISARELSMSGVSTYMDALVKDAGVYDNVISGADITSLDGYLASL